MKKSVSCLLILSLAVIALSGCSKPVETIQYEVITEQDISFLNVKRMTFRVVVEPTATDEQLLQVFSKIDPKDYDDVTMWFYKDRLEATGAYTVAMLERTSKGAKVTVKRRPN